MVAICVDPSAPALETALALCRQVPLLREVHGFVCPEEALSYAEGHPVDLAVLETHFPGMTGPILARRLSQRQKDLSVLFLTDDPGYALEAFSVHASGYLIKPADVSLFVSEAALALSRARPSRPPLFPVRVQTFGQFTVFAAGQAVVFHRARARELLAFLVDRRGGSVTRAEAFAVLWEEVPYDRGMQKQLDVIIRSLRQTLSAYGIREILEMKSGTLRVVPERLDCDLYRFLEGDRAAERSFCGEYMASYSWASMTESDLLRRMMG